MQNIVRIIGLGLRQSRQAIPSRDRKGAAVGAQQRRDRKGAQMARRGPRKRMKVVSPCATFILRRDRKGAHLPQPILPIEISADANVPGCMTSNEAAVAGHSWRASSRTGSVVII